MSDTQRPTLAEFLLARIEEDETTARALDWLPPLVTDGSLPSIAPALTAHIARHDPVRVLGECRAKRRILGQVFDLDSGDGYTEATRDAVTQLAAVYASHPDYDPDWKPEQDYTRPHDSPGGQDEHPGT